jgi:hypothetical protein
MPRPKRGNKRYNRKAAIRYRQIKLMRAKQSSLTKARAAKSKVPDTGIIILSGDVKTGVTPIGTGNQSLAMCITTAGRQNPTIARAIRNIRQVGFRQPLHVFAEPNAVDDDTITGAGNDVVVHRHQRQQGCYKNWRHTMEWMAANTTEDWVLSMQDDVVWCWNGPHVLQHAMDNVKKDMVGFLSPYTSPAVLPERALRVKDYWVRARRRNFWGAIALCFPREALEYMIKCPIFVNHTHHRQVDVVVGNVFFHSPDQRWPYVHNPSLANHTGKTSTIGRDQNPHSQWARHGHAFNSDYEPKT